MCEDENSLDLFNYYTEDEQNYYFCYDTRYNEKCGLQLESCDILYLIQVQLDNNTLTTYFVFFNSLFYNFSLKIYIVINIYSNVRRLEVIKQINREVIITNKKEIIDGYEEGVIVAMQTDDDFGKELMEYSKNGILGIQLKGVDYDNSGNSQNDDLYFNLEIKPDNLDTYLVSQMIKNGTKRDYSKLIGDSENNYINKYTIDSIKGNCNLKLSVTSSSSVDNREKTEFNLVFIKIGDSTQNLTVSCQFLTSREIICSTDEIINEKYKIKENLYEDGNQLLFLLSDQNGKEYNIVCSKKKISIVLMIVIVVCVLFVIAAVIIGFVLLKKKKKKKDSAVKVSDVVDLTRNKEQERSYDHILKNNYVSKEDTKKIK